MTALSDPAADATPQASAYIASLFDALGDRDPFQVMRDMPDALRRAIDGLTDAELATAEAPGKWCLGQVVQHLSDAELVGGFRYRMILAHDRPPIPGYDQDLWVQRVHRADGDYAAALEEFAAFRRANLRLLARTTRDERERIGVHSERGPESLVHVIRTYAGHDIVHLRQMARIRATVTGTR